MTIAIRHILKPRRPADVLGAVVGRIAVPMRGVVRGGWRRAMEGLANEAMDEALVIVSKCDSEISAVSVSRNKLPYPSAKSALIPSPTAEQSDNPIKRTHAP